MTNPLVQINSFVPLGIAPFPVSPGLQYLHDLEQTVERTPVLAIPSVAGPYGGPAQTGWLVKEGPEWISVEKAAIDKLLAIIRQIRPGKYADNLAPEMLVPFAFPVMYADQRGGRSPAYGCWMARRKRIFLLRRYLLFRWPLMMNVIYHEGVHSVEDTDADNPKPEKDSELLAHTESVAFLTAALDWTRSLTGDPGLINWVHTLFTQLRSISTVMLADLEKM